MLKPKNIAYLKSLANRLDPIVTVGKGEIDENLIQSIENALKARELIKIRLLDSVAYDRKEMGPLLAEKAHAELVSVLGRVVTLYRPKEKPVIVLPY